ncbi:YceD family protein [Desulfatitalea tepidiphila]|uniref:YceD family protein n=1 Tax=Desulfatitalea tepidiphila TaxID=1185843 RepID=UPI0006B49061|nr:DUF177 domain-containing protein [Desulfatitalea tepidiphila]
MKIEVQHIPSQGTRLSYLKPARAFPVIKEMEEHGECLFNTPIAIELDVLRERELIRVDGVVSATVRLACSRCLETYDHDLRHRFRLRFSRQIPTDVHSGGKDEVELTAEQIGLIFFREDTIELKDAIQEQIVLSIPYKPLCSESCKGLCPQCGADLNQGPCGCPAQRAGNPFEVLKNRQWPT